MNAIKVDPDVGAAPRRLLPSSLGGQLPVMSLPAGTTTVLHPFAPKIAPPWGYRPARNQGMILEGSIQAKQFKLT
jgi:hypothetical protein